jgi:hypothetical protein
VGFPATTNAQIVISFPGFCPAKDRDLAQSVTLFYLAETPDSCCAASSEKQFPSILKGGVADARRTGWVFLLPPMPKTLFSFPGFCSAKDRDLAKNVTLFYLAEIPDSCCASFSTPLKLHGSEYKTLFECFIA